MDRSQLISSHYSTDIPEKKPTVVYCRYFVKLIVFACFLELSVYLWRNEIFKNTRPRFIPNSLVATNQTDLNVTLTSDSIASIEPFPTITLDENNIDNATNILEKYNWWDLWKNDHNCNRHKVNLLKQGTQPQPGAFVSFPGSGNTWLRNLVMAITGVYITSIYENENRFYRSEDYYETHSVDGDIIPVNCGCSLLQKTHDFSLLGQFAKLPTENLTRTLDQYQGKGILIIRNPFKAIQSYRNFQFAGMEGSASSKVFHGKDWNKFVSQSIPAWETLAKVWIGGLKQGGIIYYERLCNDTKSELKRLMKMINFKYDTNRFECVIRHSQDNSMKRKVHHKLRNPFTTSQILLIHKAIRNVQWVLKERGLDPLPVELYEFFDTNL